MPKAFSSRIRRSRSFLGDCLPSGSTPPPPISSTSSVSSRVMAVISEWSAKFSRHCSTSSTKNACLHRRRRRIRGFEPVGDPSEPRHRSLERLAQANELITRRGKPQRLAGIGIEDDVRGGGAELLPGIEHPGPADAVDPRAVLHERGLMHVAAEHDVWLVLS